MKPGDIRPRYRVWFGRLKADRFPADTLDAAFKMACAQAWLNGASSGTLDKPVRIRVFDTEPGWLHMIYDSKSGQ